jgi:transcriptional regulator with XRE-family HTH domain
MNRGALALKKKLQKRGAKADLARYLGIGPYIVSKWLSGDSRPDPPMRARLEDKYRIGWSWWDQTATGEEVAA